MFASPLHALAFLSFSYVYLFPLTMANNLFNLIINNFSVGTWLQTLVFYFILFALAHIILVQFDLSITKWASRRSSLD
jgi:hypothetical protein